MGADLGEALELDDVTFTIAITPNRPDCLSVIGIAREIAALTGAKLCLPGADLVEKGEDIREYTAVSIHDPDLCPRYTARLIKHIGIRQSPLWMRMRLEGAGLRPINNVVDVTNFVMMEMGQPLHAFDYQFLTEGRIVVRRSREGEVFTTLDERERILKPDILLICDGNKPVAIAGIMGGVNSGVTGSTDTVLLESAYFNPQSIRISARWLGMQTDASFRFERGIDPEGVIRAQNRAALLIEELSGGVACRGVIDQYPCQIQRATRIPLRPQRVRDLTGTDITVQEMVAVLESLEMTVASEGESLCFVTPPTSRVDLEREIDLIEEITRIRGYESVPETLPRVTFQSIREEGRETLEKRVQTVLRGRGYSEVITYSFISPAWADTLSIPERDEKRSSVSIRNPLSEDQSVMRTTLLCGLLETMIRNVRTGSSDLKIFEMGKVFYAVDSAGLPREKNHCACLLTGVQEAEIWHSKRDADFYDLKGSAESLFSDLRIGDIIYDSARGESFLKPGVSAAIMLGDRHAGYIGEVSRDVMAKLGLRNKVFVLELDLDLLSEFFSPQVAFRDISRYPAITRDVALVMRKEIEAAYLDHIIHNMGEDLLEKANIFDVYEGKGVPEGCRSVGVRLTYRSPEKTLTDEEVARVHGGIIQKVLEETGAVIRG